MRLPACVVAACAVAAVATAAAGCAHPAPKPAPAVAAPSPTPKPAPPSSGASGPEPLAPPFTRSTLQGVYTDEEARAGDQVYKAICASCHTPVTYTGPTFRTRWAGKPLSTLYTLIQKTMPQNSPGSLDEYSYGVVLAYILKLNGMPAGKAPIMGDSVDLTKIRWDTVRSPPGGTTRNGR